MKEETYFKAKSIMDEVEALQNLKTYQYPPECYHVCFSTGTGDSITANTKDIGADGMAKLIKAYTEIIDGLIERKLKQLEGL